LLIGQPSSQQFEVIEGWW